MNPGRVIAIMHNQADDDFLYERVRRFGARHANPPLHGLEILDSAGVFDVSGSPADQKLFSALDLTRITRKTLETGIGVVNFMKMHGSKAIAKRPASELLVSPLVRVCFLVPRRLRTLTLFFVGFCCLLVKRIQHWSS